jgi:tRNA pseudouridine32 synthase/23S rRNA pseudouridine746 synthase
MKRIRKPPATGDVLPTLLDYHPPREPWLSVVHEEDDFIVLDKPSGLLSVPGRHPSLSDSIRLRARSRWPTAEMVHRLDKDTSGLILLALNKPAHAKLGAQFEARATEKAYIARVAGRIADDNGTVDLPIAVDWDNKPRHRVDFEHGRPALTEWRVLDREENATRLRLMPHTGRTHQLRVHMKAIGHVILGDAFYAEDEALAAADRLQLHAAELGFAHPRTGEKLRFVSPAPF